MAFDFLEVQSKPVELWEIYKDGKDGDIFEITECTNDFYVGKKVRVIEDENFQGKYKALLKADTPEDMEHDTLVTIYGCLGTAKYSKVEKVRQIDLETVIARLKNCQPVWLNKVGEGEKQFSKYADFKDLDIYDFDDLMKAEFFVKGNS